jgi:hypothetical protein
MGDEVKVNRRKCDLAYLFAAPLWGNLGVKLQETIIKPLDFQKEQKDLFETLSNSDKALRLKIEVATHDKLIALTLMGLRALHFSGHGQENMLAFENGLGKVHCMTPADILNLLSAGGQNEGIEFVFVSACNSENVGKAFVQAGVPHVIAVRRQEQVADDAARMFMKQFYLAVLVGRTVKNAFEIALAAVKTGIIEGNEPKKFLLLPQDGDHNVEIFRDVPAGQFINLNEKEKPNNLCAPIENFLGRNFEVQELVEKLADSGISGRKLILLTGVPRIGKTTLALEGARYCHQRRMFDGVYLIDFQHIGNMTNPPPSLAALVGEELSMPTVTTNRQLAISLKNKNFVLILDNVDPVLATKRNGPFCIKSLIESLITVQIKVLVTCRTAIQDLPMHWSIEVNSLKPHDSARLFFLSASRSLEPSEYGAKGVHDATKLGQHKVLQMMLGNPGKLKMAAQKLTQEIKMEQLPELMENTISNWDQLVAFTPFLDLASLSFTGSSPPPKMERLPQFPIADPSVRDQATSFWLGAFGTSTEVAWDSLEMKLSDRFANISPMRDLEPADYQEIKDCYFKDTFRVTIPAFCRFWAWWMGFEHCIHKTLNIWNEKGIIQSLHFNSKAAAQILRACETGIGTFLLRPSISMPGNLAVGYVETDGSVKQMLIDANQHGFKINLMDIGDRVYDTLPELIMKCKKLRILWPRYDKEQIFCAQEEDMPH